MDMVETGGYLVLQTPANNNFRHGFISFSQIYFSGIMRPELFEGMKKKRFYKPVKLVSKAV
ncbi:MAG: hypothetical protein LBB22_00195 [Treponema sp.]|jgi:predicted DNA-binding transcriptional regulator AlpA|nr:hypothetical protein [Treponema sp.]